MGGALVEELRIGESQKEDLRIENLRTEQLPTRQQLELTLGCDRAGKTVLKNRYMAYPLSVSPLFRRESDGVNLSLEQRAYLYRMNTSPGLLARDVLGMSVKLNSGSSLHLMDQAATKVHQMPAKGDSPFVQ